MSNCSSYLIQIETSATSNTINGIQLSNYLSTGIQVYGDNSIIENSNISSNDSVSWHSCIEIVGNNVTISGCTLLNGADISKIVNSAVSVQSSASNLIIQNNQVLGGFYYGVYVNSGSLDTVIKNNNITGCAVNVYNLGSGTQIS